MGTVEIDDNGSKARRLNFLNPLVELDVNDRAPLIHLFIQYSHLKFTVEIDANDSIPLNIILPEPHS
jgi:hypothetical protein